MELFDQQSVAWNDTIITAIGKIDKLSGNALVLFVLNEKQEVIGTLTDGDVRRALLKGVQLDSEVFKVMKSNFAYLSEEEKDHVATICKLRAQNITLVPLLDANKHLVRVFNFKLLKSILPIDAILMAGGKGERLRPLTERIPKPLLPVGDRAIIDHNIDRLISYGVEYISVTVNYLKEQLEEHFQKPRNGVQVTCVAEPKYLGTIGSIQFVRNFYNDTVLVMNSDLFTDIDYEDFFIHFVDNEADMSVAAVPYSVSVPYGIMDLDGRKLKGMIEKPTYNYYANAGIYLIKKEMLQFIPQEEFFNATDLIDVLIANGRKVIRFPINGTWIDIGTPEEYQKAKDLVKHLR